MAVVLTAKIELGGLADSRLAADLRNRRAFLAPLQYERLLSA